MLKSITSRFREGVGKGVCLFRTLRYKRKHGKEHFGIQTMERLAATSYKSGLKFSAPLRSQKRDSEIAAIPSDRSEICRNG